MRYFQKYSLLYSIRLPNYGGIKVVFLRYYDQYFLSNVALYRNKVALVLVRIGIIYFIAGIMMAYAQVAGHHAYSIFTYNIIKYTHWPNSLAEGDIQIAFVGDSKVYESMQLVAQRKTINGRAIKVKKVNQMADLRACHMVYVTEKNFHWLSDVVDFTNESSTVVLTEKPQNKVTGVGISFIVVNGRLRFKLYDEVLDKKDIHVSVNLRKLAY